MKTRFPIYIFLFLIVFCNSILNADTIIFNSKNIKIEEDGNIIIASQGTANIPDQNILIEGDKSIYNKNISELFITGNVKFFDNLNDTYVESEKAIYNEKKNTLLAIGITFIKVKDKYDIYSKDILYDRNSMKISSKLDTSILDKLDNIYILDDGFLFDTFKEVISSRKTNVIDKNRNSYLFDLAKVNLKTREIVGKEVEINFEDSFFGNEKNDPKLKGKSTTSDDNETIINKAVFSTCNIENKKCRGWEIQSDEFIHNKVDKLFEYKNSWVKIFDQRLFYLPYFNHPDPTVKRKSGFLTPFYTVSKNLGSSINVPYFYALSDFRDFTFNPRLYRDNDYILQSEYRQAFENSNLIADFSLNKEENTNTHFFAELDGSIDDKTEYKIQVQNVTNDNYLKIHKIQEHTELIKNDSTLTSYISMDKQIDDETTLDISATLYEDLSKGDTDKYQYVLPNFTFKKNINIDESYNGNFRFLSSGFQKVFDTNKHEALISNDFNFNSYNFINSKGIVSNYGLLLKNYNTYSKQSNNYDNKSDHEIFGTMLIKSELPLKKELKNSNNFLTPIAQFRFSPSNGKNISGSDKRLNFGNIFSTNRIGQSDMVENGRSLTLGIKFEKQNLNNDKIFGLNLGNVLKDKKDDNLPAKSRLNQTRSDIVGDLFYKFNDKLKLGYNFSYDRDLEHANYESINAEFGVNKFITSFDYIRENKDFGNTEIISNQTQYDFSEEHKINFNTTKELNDDFTQFYKLSYMYETDCLSANFEYEKKFYRDGNLVPDESLIFLIKLIPFAEIRGTANTVFKYK